MNATIIDADCMRDASGCTLPVLQNDKNTYATNGLAMWMLQRLPGQMGRWYVSLSMRGLSVSCMAVVDDFGNLQMVAA